MKTANVACVFAVALPLLLKDAWRLTALKLADERARALGVHVDGLPKNCTHVPGARRAASRKSIYMPAIQTRLAPMALADPLRP